MTELSPIISLHLPKTAGSSFCASLHEHFGERLYRDYGNGVTRTSAYERLKGALELGLKIGEQGLGEFLCVHGHFVPIKYWLLNARQPLTFVTWLRNPVDRAVSHYHYWMRSYDPEFSAPHHRRVVEERWSLERFCLGEEFRNIYAQFLSGFPLAAFRFVGVTEHYEEDFAYFAEHILQSPIREQKINVGNSAQGGRYEIDTALRRAIETHHRLDCDLYEEALHLRKLRMRDAMQMNEASA